MSGPVRTGVVSLSCSGCAGVILLALFVPGLNLIGWTPLPVLAGPIALLGVLQGFVALLWSGMRGMGLRSAQYALAGTVVGALSMALFLALWNGWLAWLR